MHSTSSVAEYVHVCTTSLVPNQWLPEIQEWRRNGGNPKTAATQTCLLKPEVSECIIIITAAASTLPDDWHPDDDDDDGGGGGP